ncbi:hypothetical protein V493_00678 [Pseudogymnoascus sp. VKM F-4281 (FW-2241)]|nr:hypothetical protein V493_00678 [Pseudogymnoascus sp. VKM F-4281 (FW-2241)]
MRGASIIAAVATALLVPLSSAKCAHNDAASDAAIAGCGDVEEVAKCFASGVKSTQLFDCLVSSGCTEGQAETVQPWHDGDCKVLQANDGDLRRRQAVRRSMPKITATPTVAPRFAQEGEMTIAAVPQVTALEQAAEKPVCLKTKTIETSFCETITEAGSPTTKCLPTTTESIGCNDGLICSKDPKGITLCMESKAPDLVGIIVSACLSVAFFAMFGSVLFMSCRTRSRQRLVEKQREAMLIANGAKLGASASEAHLPLMQPQAAQAGHNRDVSADYSAPRTYGGRPNSRRASPSGSPFRDVSSTRGSNVLTKSPPPAPGSGDMGLGTEARNPMNMEDNDIGYSRHS